MHDHSAQETSPFTSMLAHSTKDGKHIEITDEARKRQESRYMPVVNKYVLYTVPTALWVLRPISYGFYLAHAYSSYSYYDLVSDLFDSGRLKIYPLSSFSLQRMRSPGHSMRGTLSHIDAETGAWNESSRHRLRRCEPARQIAAFADCHIGD